MGLHQRGHDRVGLVVVDVSVRVVAHGKLYVKQIEENEYAFGKFVNVNLSSEEILQGFHQNT